MFPHSSDTVGFPRRNGTELQFVAAAYILWRVLGGTFGSVPLLPPVFVAVI